MTKYERVEERKGTANVLPMTALDLRPEKKVVGKKECTDGIDWP